MPVRTLSIALVSALLAAGSAAASLLRRTGLPPVCATSCVAAKPGTGPLFLFSGHGWGHGVGMSEYGAWGFALHGYDYEQILQHYYPGTTVATAPVNTIRVLLADGRKSLELSCSVPFTVTDANGVTRSLPAGPVTLTPKIAAPPLTFAASSGGW